MSGSRPPTCRGPGPARRAAPQSGIIGATPPHRRYSALTSGGRMSEPSCASDRASHWHEFARPWHAGRRRPSVGPMQTVTRDSVRRLRHLQDVGALDGRLEPGLAHRLGLLLGLLHLGRDLVGACALGLDHLLLLLDGELLLLERAALGARGRGVERLHRGEVLEGVLLERRALGRLARGAHNGLHLVRVDETAEVRVLHHGVGQVEARLDLRLLGVRAEDLVEGSEGGLGPDAEAAEVAARGELQEVEAVDGAELDAGDVAEGALNGLLAAVLVDDERPAAHRVPAVAHLALARAHLLGVGALLHVRLCAQLGEQVHRRRSLIELLSRVGDDEGNLGDRVDTVAARHHQRRDGGSGEGGGRGVPALRLVHLGVPLAEGLVRGEHTAATAHVAEGTRAGSVRAAALHARNT
mmetsp:Transcript_14568/g.42775  ORF Transcript_14568/g.42775 Transcript_14568/m.42775 type:complete len:411 (+) Transcript_14568:37-1269(+)